MHDDTNDKTDKELAEMSMNISKEYTTFGINVNWAGIEARPKKAQR